MMYAIRQTCKMLGVADICCHGNHIVRYGIWLVFHMNFLRDYDNYFVPRLSQPFIAWYMGYHWKGNTLTNPHLLHEGHALVDTPRNSHSKQPCAQIPGAKNSTPPPKYGCDAKGQTLGTLKFEFDTYSNTIIGRQISKYQQ